MKIFVVGSLNMDLVIKAPFMPENGMTIGGEGFMTNPGGKGANQAAAIGKLGGNVRMVGCVGEAFGAELKGALDGYGVNTEYVKSVGGVSSGIAVIIVVDGDNRLVGIVTFDDAMDVIEEETTEDFEKMAAILPSDKPYLKTGVFETWRSRIPWLMLLMLSATFTGIIITKFESALAACVVLTSFIPMLSGTGGNSGSQSSVAVIRALSLDEIDFSDLIAVVWKESRVAVLCGVCLACANFVKMMIVDRWLMNNPAVTPVVALVVCLTLVFTVLCAKVVGCTLPMAAEKIGIDPAVMASPFITTIVDALSLLIYFFFATHLLTLS